MTVVACLCDCRHRSLTGDSIHPTGCILSKHQLERQAFQKCSTQILESLNIAAILPHLIDQGLLTQREIEIMMNMSKTNYDKTLYLISQLPRNGDGFFEKFILCLCKSGIGTGHSDILKALTVELNDVKRAQSYQVAKV